MPVMATTVLVLGATGMLARPVVRQLVADGFTVRAGVRSVAKAKRLLPGECQFMHADVQDAASIKRALDGCEVVYTNLAQPYSRRAFDPDLRGAELVAAHAKSAGVHRVMRISTMGLPHGASTWWVAERKQRSDEALRGSGVPYTIFQPTWLMESLPLFMLGRRILLPEAADDVLYWIAGADYAKQVSNAIRSERAANRTYVVQGKYPVSMKHAIIRFNSAYDPTRSLLRVPRPLLAAAGFIRPQASYLLGLLEFTFKFATGFHAEETFEELGEPTLTIEDYARHVRATGDVPMK
jgi:uncharacterized protein YbjT (DUF2867 family)